MQTVYTLSLTCLSLLLFLSHSLFLFLLFPFLSFPSPYLEPSLKHTCAFIFIPVQTLSLSITHLNLLLKLISRMRRLTPPPLLTVMSFHWLCGSVVLNNMRVFAFYTLRQISPHTVTRRTSLSPVFHQAM